MKKTFAYFGNFSLLKRFIAPPIISALLLCHLPAHANNPAPDLKADAPNRYVVQKGDTLWDISGRYLDRPWQWREIWAANKQVKNPHLIYPNDILLMCVIRGETLIGIDTGEGCAGIERDMRHEELVEQQVTITQLNGSIPTIPLSKIEKWLDKTSIVHPIDFDATPYVLASKSGRLLTGVGDTVYTKGAPLIMGQRYGVYREGKPYIDPLSNQVIGREVQQIASGIVRARAPNGVNSINLTDTYDKEVRQGDRVFIKLPNNTSPLFYPKPAEVNRGGQVIRIMDSISRGANGSVIAINLGSKHGAQSGDVLSVFQHGALVADSYDNEMPVRLPSEQIGHVMVFKTFDKISYAYVLDASLPIETGDRLLPPAHL